MAVLNLKVNGKAQSVDVDPDSPLLFTLSDNLQLNGPKFGCGLAQCGSCTVLLDGQPIRSCTTPVSAAAGHDVLTIDGLGTAQNAHPIQHCFVAEQAAQCGYCLSGVMLYGLAFIDKTPNATQEQIAGSLSGLICRCHTHTRIVKALNLYASIKRGTARIPQVEMGGDRQ